MTPPVTPLEYRCPGQSYPIGRAVHLGRLARFYPDCRQCPHRDDTGTLSPRHVRQLQETQPRGQPQSLLADEALVGRRAGDIEPKQARLLGIAWGLGLHEPVAAAAEAPIAVVAGDGRPATPPLQAAIVEGLRWSGCHVVDAGSASAPCLVRTIDHLQASGGLLLGSGLGRPEIVSLKFWAGGQPLAEPQQLAELLRRAAGPFDRPTRAFGGWRSFVADQHYLDALAEQYHALRPLRLVLDTTCLPVLRYLRRLTALVACRVVESRPGEELPAQVLAERAHFGVQIGDDGEACQFIDERGAVISAERMALCLARQQLAETPGAAFALDARLAATVGPALEAAGGRVAAAEPGRSNMARTMRGAQAVLGADAAGRIWFSGGSPAADALQALSRLLVVLSHSDRRLSAIVA